MQIEPNRPPGIHPATIEKAMASEMSPGDHEATSIFLGNLGDWGSLTSRAAQEINLKGKVEIMHVPAFGLRKTRKPR